MASESARLIELRRRVHQDPAPFAFAQLAEEYRRAGFLKEAVRCCRDSLARYPSYLSARVILGRALAELDRPDEAVGEYEMVLEASSDNLAATRGLAEVYERQGRTHLALQFFTRAYALAPHDPMLKESVERISRQLKGTPPVPAAATAVGKPAPPATDLDRVLEKLGAPDHEPPPLTAMLLASSDSALPSPCDLDDAPLCDLQAVDALAMLERGLREREEAMTRGETSEPTGAVPSTDLPANVPDPSVRILSELEAWLQALTASDSRKIL